MAIPGLLLAQNDKDRKVLSPEREVAVVNTYSELLEEMWPESPAAADAAAPVLVVSAHGALNFAAALSVSALLRLKNVPHRLLPPDAVQPGKFPEELADGRRHRVPVLSQGAVCREICLSRKADRRRGCRTRRSSALPGRTARAPAPMIKPGARPGAAACGGHPLRSADEGTFRISSELSVASHLTSQRVFSFRGTCADAPAVSYTAMLDGIKQCQRTEEITPCGIMAVLILTLCQFTAFPFLAMVAANTARQSEESRLVRHAELPNVTTIYKTVRM